MKTSFPQHQEVCASLPEALGVFAVDSSDLWDDDCDYVFLSLTAQLWDSGSLRTACSAVSEDLCMDRLWDCWKEGPRRGFWQFLYKPTVQDCVWGQQVSGTP